MRPVFHPRLVNGPFEDPTLFIPFFFDKRALLFDLGDLHRLPPRDTLKITHAFVTHTHMDHFTGFDALLRIFLGRDRELHLFGPPPFLRNVKGKLEGYTWNLVENYDKAFVLRATEVHPDHTLTQVFQCNRAFNADQIPMRGDFDGALLREPAFSVHAVHLDHKLPCLAFMLQERFHVNIMKGPLKALHLPVGPWLRQLKEALYKSQDPEEDFHVVWEEDGKKGRATFRLGDLCQQVVRVSPGQKIVYIVDVIFSPENIEKMIHFARHADQLFIEAAFLDADAHVAQRKYHLTAKQAGIVARKAGVKHVTLCHFSPRYAHQGSLLEKEAHEAFKERISD